MTTSFESLEAALADRYTILRELGVGGMARVYLGEDLKHHRKVAVKVLKEDLAQALGFERFLREIQIAAQLNHPHILPLYDSGEAGGILYYVMPYVEGETLRDRLIREGQLPIEEALQIVAEVGDALGFAHSRGVIHRDIKPENILLQSGHAYVADFGIARAIDVAGGQGITETGLAVGTPGYMSPEQAAGETHLDGRADVFALGCLAYELLTGRPPHTGPTRQATLAKVMTEAPVPLSATRPTVPPHVEYAIIRSLQKLPADRYQTTAALLEALKESDESDFADKSIVVLPFENLSPDAENAFFADGLTDEIITDLSKVRALRVISRNTSVVLKDSGKDLRTIGRELNVRYVLEGTVRRAGSSLRVTAQLVDATMDTHLWAEKYTGSMEDIFEIQERLARQIVEQLQIVLTPAEAASLADRSVQDPGIYDRLLRVRADIATWSPSGIDRAITDLEHLLAEHGEDVVLLGEAARAHSIRADAVTCSVHDLVQAATYAGRGLALDPASKEALHVIGVVHWLLGDIGFFARNLRRVLSLDPHFTPALFYGAGTAAILCKAARARELLTVLERLDPLGLETRFARGLLHLHAGEFVPAVDMFAELVRAAPTSGTYVPWYVTALIEHDADQAPAAADALNSATEGFRMGQQAELLQFLRFVVLEDPERARPFARLGPGVFHHPALVWWYAWGSALLEDWDQAMAWLGRAVDAGRIGFPFYAEHSRVFSPLRSDQRFVQLLAECRTRWDELQT